MDAEGAGDGAMRAGDTCECAVCHDVFESGWDDEDALAGMQETWQPAEGDDDPGVVCDDCYREFFGWAETKAPEVLRNPPR